MPMVHDRLMVMLTPMRAASSHTSRRATAMSPVGAGWGERRQFAGEVPVTSMQAAALHHPNPKVRREALGVLDHFASDTSTATFRAVLSDPVPRVRIVALHGLSCERCRVGEIRVDDVVTDVLRVRHGDPNPRVRHGAIDVLARFSAGATGSSCLRYGR
jgi:HEAT repeats